MPGLRRRLPKAGLAFGGQVGAAPRQSYDPSRRQVLGALGASLGGVALLQIAPRNQKPDPHRLRPPGARENALLAACLRCGACIRACPPTRCSRPSPRPEPSACGRRWWLPRIGACTYSCTACGDGCPTGAIPRLALETKRLTPIGKAYIDPDLCIAWSGRGDCIVCEEMCPVPQKSITLLETTVADAEGNAHVRKLPVVGYERCIGCGLCESKCPINGPSAIRVIVVDPWTCSSAEAAPAAPKKKRVGPWPSSLDLLLAANTGRQTRVPARATMRSRCLVACLAGQGAIRRLEGEAVWPGSYFPPPLVRTIDIEQHTRPPAGHRRRGEWLPPAHRPPRRCYHQGQVHFERRHTRDRPETAAPAAPRSTAPQVRSPPGTTARSGRSKRPRTTGCTSPKTPTSRPCTRSAARPAGMNGARSYDGRIAHPRQVQVMAKRLHTPLRS
jgi:ferredoxin